MREFLMKGFRQNIYDGRKPDDWTILNSAGWMDKGTLTETDLAELDRLMKERAGMAVEQFSLREYLMRGYRLSIENRSMPDYKIINTSANWMAQGVLTTEDLEELDRLMKERKGDQT